MTTVDVRGYERYERARASFAEERYDEAARLLEDFFTDLAAARQDPEVGQHPEHDPVGHGTAEIRLLLARSYYHSAQLTRAERAARAVIEESPDDAYAHLILGRTLQRSGRADEARGPLRLAELLGGYTAG